MDGWIKLYRCIYDSWVWEDKPFSKGQAWIDIIMMANHETKKFPLGSKLVNVERGSFITSIRKLCNRWGWSNTKVKSFLCMLQEDKMITFKSDTKNTLITIENYSKYQDNENEKTTQKRRKNDSETTQKHTNKNEKNEKNIYTLIQGSQKVPDEPALFDDLPPKNFTQINYSAIAEMWNSICAPPLPKIQKITEARKQKMKIRITEMGGYQPALDTLKQIFEKVKASDFLNGNNKNNWQASFDWVFENGKNWVKIIEGNYDNKKGYDPIQNEIERAKEKYKKQIYNPR